MNSDYELFTILAQDDDISALQVKNRDGEWIHADPIPVFSTSLTITYIRELL